MVTWQTRNTVFGDLAGNNIYKFIFGSNDGMYGGLLKKIIEEEKKGKKVNNIIDGLSHYTERKDGDVDGLEQKLVNGGYSDRLDDAMYKKEQFAKLIFRYENYLSAQNFFLKVLSYVEHVFSAKVMPRIKAGESEIAVFDIVSDDIVKSIYKDLGDNRLDINVAQIEGMVYYLTGNCHIRWK